MEAITGCRGRGGGLFRVCMYALCLVSPSHTLYITPDSAVFQLPCSAGWGPINPRRARDEQLVSRRRPCRVFGGRVQLGQHQMCSGVDLARLFVAARRPRPAAGGRDRLGG
jgi:hypothetical protein